MSGNQPEVQPDRPIGRHLRLIPAVIPPPDREQGWDDIHSWIDGELPPREAAAVGRRLSGEPLAAASAVAYQAQVQGLHALYDPILDEPIPPRLLAVLGQFRSAERARRKAAEEEAQRHRHRLLLMAGIAAAMAVLSGGLAIPFLAA